MILIRSDSLFFNAIIRYEESDPVNLYPDPGRWSSVSGLPKIMKHRQCCRETALACKVEETVQPLFLQDDCAENDARLRKRECKEEPDFPCA